MIRHMIFWKLADPQADRAALEDLFTMTPYRWKTPRQGIARMEALDGLSVTASFRIHVFRRK